MSPQRFEHLLTLVGPSITKQDTSLRKSISAVERLVVTLRFLASGDAQQSMSYSFRIGKTTLSHIISETCNAIYEHLRNDYLCAPKSEEDWLKIAASFNEQWTMPHVIGTIDGKHIRMQCPKFSGTQLGVKTFRRLKVTKFQKNFVTFHRRNFITDEKI